MRIAFCRDASWEPTGVQLTQPESSVDVAGEARDQTQVERILGLDVDATSFGDVGTRDPVIGRLQAAAPGLRPPQLHSAYEAAAFCILTARRSAAQARRMRQELAHRAGTILDISGQSVVCLPPPGYLVDPEPVPGLDPVRRQRLQSVAQAALDGMLDTAALAAMPPADARTHLEQLPGIGPFSSAIIAVRALGHKDLMAGTITELNTSVGLLYDLGHPATPGELDDISRAWSPWRTWSQLYIRSVSPRLSTTPGGSPHPSVRPPHPMAGHTEGMVDRAGLTEAADDAATWSVPEACTLPTVEQPLRVAEFESVFARAVRRVERPEPTLLLLTLDGADGIEADARDLAARESACCSFFAFAFGRGADGVTLGIRVPAAQVAVLDGLASLAASAAGPAPDRP